VSTVRARAALPSTQDRGEPSTDFEVKIAAWACALKCGHRLGDIGDGVSLKSIRRAKTALGGPNAGAVIDKEYARWKDIDN
jgi:hypothetical protein